MKRFIRFLLLVFGLLMSVIACMEIHPIAPLEGSDSSTGGLGTGTVCKAPSLSQNIVGTWHFESTYNPEFVTKGTITKGTITFDGQGRITDPDSLFENRLDSGGKVVAKTYEPEAESMLANYTGKLFVVYQKTSSGQQITYFTLVSNECNNIHLRLLQSGNNGIGFMLTR